MCSGLSTEAISQVVILVIYTLMKKSYWVIPHLRIINGCPPRGHLYDTPIKKWWVVKVLRGKKRLHSAIVRLKNCFALPRLFKKASRLTWGPVNQLSLALDMLDIYESAAYETIGHYKIYNLPRGLCSFEPGSLLRKLWMNGWMGE